LSGGAVRKKNPPAAPPGCVSPDEVVDPEHATTPSVLSLSTMPSAVVDDAGPRIAFTLSLVTSVLSDVEATSGLGPSAGNVSDTGLPFTPPAALISSTAICTGVHSDL